MAAQSKILPEAAPNQFEKLESAKAASLVCLSLLSLQGRVSYNIGQ